MKLRNLKYKKHLIALNIILVLIFICVLSRFKALSNPNTVEYSPYLLVFDLGVKGIKVIGIGEPYTHFDFNNDGFAERTEWISGDDGFLCIDKNHNNEIDNITELFSIDSIYGLENLRQLDSNKDGVIDNKDILYTNLKIWQDINKDGLTNKNELKSLIDLGIKNFTLNTKNINVKKQKIASLKPSNYVSADNITHKNGIKYIRFIINRTYSRYNNDYIISADTMDLPWLRGYGRILDLQPAINKNEKLKLKVEELVNIQDSYKLYNHIDEFLECWTNSDKISNFSMSGAIKTKRVRILAEFVADDEFNYVPEDRKLYFEEAYRIIKNKLYVDFIAQTIIGEQFDISYDFKNDTIITTDTTYEKLVTNLTDKKLYFASYMILDFLKDEETLNLSKLRSQINKSGYGIELIKYLNSGYKLNNSGEYNSVQPIVPLIRQK